MSKATHQSIPAIASTLRPSDVRARWAVLALARAQPDRLLACAAEEPLWRLLMSALVWTPEEARQIARVVQGNRAIFLQDGSLGGLPWDEPVALAEELSRLPFVDGKERRRRRRKPAVERLSTAYERLLKSKPRAVREHLDRCFALWEKARSALSDSVARNLGALKSLFAWGSTVVAVLELASAASEHEPLCEVLRDVNVGGDAGAARLVASLFELDEAALQEVFDSDGFLAQCGILELSECITDLKDVFSLGKTGRRLLRAKAERPMELMRPFVRELGPGELHGGDFAHIEQDLDLLVRALRAALDGGGAGVNILIYGPPGTGKSEFARLIATAASSAAFEVKLDDERGEEPDRKERLQSLLLAQRLLSASTRPVLVMEEAEDIFPHGEVSFLSGLFGFGHGKSRTGSKAWVNRQLETNPFPIIWISNCVEQIDPAFLRRFTYHLAMDRLPLTARRNIAVKHLGRISASGRLVEDVASDPRLAPACIASAVRFAQLVNEEDTAAREAHVRRQLQGFKKVVGDLPRFHRREGDLPYGIEFLNLRCAYRIEQIVTALRREGRGTLCFHGAPGTGKTALAAHIARETGRRLEKVTAGDLLSPWVGMSERNIARLFREHEEGETVLLIDEAEGLLHGRGMATRSWELTQVNELLRRIEEYEGMLVVATNRFDALDEAFLRRFQFKVEFLPLRAEQRVSFFRTAVGLDTLPAEVERRLARLDQLALGDYANVHRQITVIATRPTVEGFLAALEAEHAAKPGVRSSKMGFL